MIIKIATDQDISKIQKMRQSLTRNIIVERLHLQYKQKAELLVLEKDNEIISYVFLKWNGKETHPEYPDMEDLFTKETERGRGFGTLLIKECEKRAKEKGFSKLGLAVNHKLNPKAKKLYEKLGYKHDGRKSYVDGIYNGTKDWVIDLEKDL
jgi:GNAT superfamily N-acetyltransferase